MKKESGKGASELENTRSLPDRRDYVGSFRWLMAVQECIGQPFVFALDDAFMCMGLFLGYNTESVVYGYGDSSIAEAFPQVVLLGADIDEPHDRGCNHPRGRNRHAGDNRGAQCLLFQAWRKHGRNRCKSEIHAGLRKDSCGGKGIL